MNAIVRSIPGEHIKVSPPQVSGTAEAPAVVATPFRWRDPSTIPVREWLFGRPAIRRFVSLTVAAGGTGKTALTLAEQVAFVTGRDLFRDDLRTSGRAWYIGLEDPREEYERRIAAIAIHYDMTATDLNGGLFLDSGREQKFVIAAEERGGLAICQPIVEAIKANILVNEISLVTVDPFVACHTVSESDNTKIAAIAGQWAKIADETGAAIELVHHVRKGTGTEVSADDSRGASALVNAARSVRVLVPMSEQQADEAGVEERRSYFQVLSGKANRALSSTSGTWRQLVSVSLGNGNGGSDDLVGVAEPWKWPSCLDGCTVDDLQSVQDKIASSDNWRADAQSPDWVGNAVADVLGLDVTDRGDKGRIKKMLTTWTKNGALREVMGEDKKRMRRRYVVVGERATEGTDRAGRPRHGRPSHQNFPDLPHPVSEAETQALPCPTMPPP